MIDYAWGLVDENEDADPINERTCDEDAATFVTADERKTKEEDIAWTMNEPNQPSRLDIFNLLF